MSESRVMIPPPCEPVSLADAKLQLRVDSDITVDDELIASCVMAARVQVESLARRQIVLATSRVTLDAFPGSAGGRGEWGYLGGGLAGAAMAPKAWPNIHIDDAAIQLFGGPLQTIVSLKYVDTAGATQTMSASDYLVDAENDPARIMPVVGNTYNGWPDTQGGQINTVEVNAAAGWMVPFTVNTTSNYITLATGSRALENGQAVQVSASDTAGTAGSLPSTLRARTNYYAINVSGLTAQLAATSGGSAISLTTVGVGTLLDHCPEAVRQALRMLITYFYENRGDRDAPIPAAVSALLAPWKVWRF